MSIYIKYKWVCVQIVDEISISQSINSINEYDFSRQKCNFSTGTMGKRSNFWDREGGEMFVRAWQGAWQDPGRRGDTPTRVPVAGAAAQEGRPQHLFRLADCLALDRLSRSLLPQPLPAECPAGRGPRHPRRAQHHLQTPLRRILHRVKHHHTREVILLPIEIQSQRGYNTGGGY